MSDTLGTTNQVTSTTPLWYDELAQQFGSQISGALDAAGSLGQNWYNQPLSAGTTNLQSNALTAAGTAGGAWSPYSAAGWNTMGQAAPQYQQAAAGLSQVAQGFGGAGAYNPATMQQHLSPYIGGVVDEIGRRGQQNLTENLLPQVNQTFTGAGQFGGTRNADFTNRALRDTQREVLGAQSNALQNAYTQAGQDYQNWDKLGQGALTGQGQTYGQLGSIGGALGQLGSSMGQFGSQVGQQTWQDLGQQYGFGEKAQGIEQGALDRAYKDWSSQISSPINTMGALSQMMTQVPSLYSGSKTQIVAPQQAPSSDLSMLLAIMSGAFG